MVGSSSCRDEMVPTKIPSSPKSRTIFVPRGHLNTLFSDVGGASSTSVDGTRELRVRLRPLGVSLVVLVGEFVFGAGEPRDCFSAVSSLLVVLERCRLAGPFGVGGVVVPGGPRDFLHVFWFFCSRRFLFSCRRCDISSRNSFANCLIVSFFLTAVVLSVSAVGAALLVVAVVVLTILLIIIIVTVLAIVLAFVFVLALVFIFV